MTQENNLTAKLEKLHSRLADLTARLDRMTNDHAELSNRLDKIEDGLPKMATAIRELRKNKESKK